MGRYSIKRTDILTCNITGKNISALTTNNTLLNTEVQKGIYDGFIREAGRMLSFIPADERMLEIAFILSAYHGLKLVKKFGGKVSVELHTALSHDNEPAYVQNYPESSAISDSILYMGVTESGTQVSVLLF